MKPIESVYDVKAQQETLRRRRYGVIEAAEGKLVRIQLRPWPKFASLLEAHWIRAMKSTRKPKDLCRLYYNEPSAHPGFLTLVYVESSLKTSAKTVFATLGVLDQIAYIKHSNAIIADVSNQRISDRALKHWGWEPYMEETSTRHFIKRFYGTYPERVTKLLRPSYEQAMQNHLAQGHVLPPMPHSDASSAQSTTKV